MNQHLRAALRSLVIALAGCGGESTGNTSASEPPELAGIVAAHNAVRAGVGVGPLSWDGALAATAAAWAATCTDTVAPIGLLDHNPNRSSGHPWYVGENIYASSGAGAATASAAVGAWAAEVADYTYATNSCAPGKVCGHYTQVVWAATTRVGCARRECPALTYQSTIVCDYGPGGNVNGSKPY
jgi:pathogenesis-related protein 1